MFFLQLFRLTGGGLHVRTALKTNLSRRIFDFYCCGWLKLRCGCLGQYVILWQLYRDTLTGQWQTMVAWMKFSYIFKALVTVHKLFVLFFCFVCLITKYAGSLKIESHVVMANTKRSLALTLTLTMLTQTLELIMQVSILYYNKYRTQKNESRIFSETVD